MSGVSSDYLAPAVRQIEKTPVNTRPDLRHADAERFFP